MFPEVEGFTSAVPSKRDLASFLSAIRVELVTVFIESDLGLLRLLSREVLRAVNLLLTKLEGLVSSTAEVFRMQFKDGVCLRNSQQEHNFLITTLMIGLCDSLQLLPIEVLKQAQESLGEPRRSVSAQEAFKSEALDIMKAGAADASIAIIQRNLCEVVMMPMVNAVTHFTKECLLTLVTNDPLPPTGIKKANSGFSSNLCSSTIRNLECIFPAVIKTHVQSLSSSKATEEALREISVRLLAHFVSIAAMIRPFTESLRSTILADIGVIEQLAKCSESIAKCLDDPNTGNPAVRELKAFRSLLHAGALSEPINSSKNVTMMKMDSFTRALRPSTMLSYLMSMAPSQLPSPAEINDSSPAACLLMLTALPRREAGVDYGINSSFGVESILWQYCRNFKVNAGQSQFWAVVLQCLDIFMQRGAVAVDPNAKEVMRQWYELIAEIGGHFFNVEVLE